jgi:hypothetical protein
MRHTECFCDFADVALSAGLVLHHRRAADDFEVGDLGKVGKNLILHTICEVSVLFIIAQVLERKNRDAFFDNGRRR